MSSLIRRLLRRPVSRSDAQYGLPGELVLDTAKPRDPPTHYDPLFDATEHSNLDHRERVAQGDPHAFLWVYTIARNVFDDWFELVDPATDEPIPENEMVQERLELLRMKEVLTRACEEERKHGYSFIFKTLEGNRFRTPEEAGLDHFMGDDMAFSDTPVSEAREVLGAQVLPTKDIRVDRLDPVTNKPMMINYTSSVSEESEAIGAAPVNVHIHASRTWVVCPRPKDRSFVGITALEPIWETCYTLRQHVDSMASVAQKWGAFMMIIKHTGDLTSTEADRMETAAKNLSKRRYFLLQSGVWDMEMVAPPMGDSAIPEQIDILYGMLASGTGLPKTRWIGAQAGELEGSRTNLKLEYGVISAIQASYDPIIRQIIGDLFPGTVFPRFKIRWRLEYQMSEMEKAEVMALKADTALKILQMGTLVEARNHVDLKDPLSIEETAAFAQQQQQLDAQKEMAEGLKAIGGSGNPGEHKEPSKPTRGDADQARADGVFTRFVSHWERQVDPETGKTYSRRGIIRACGMSTHTLYDWLREEQPKEELRRSDLHL